MNKIVIGAAAVVLAGLVGTGCAAGPAHQADAKSHHDQSAVTSATAPAVASDRPLVSGVRGADAHARVAGRVVDRAMSGMMRALAVPETAAKALDAKLVTGAARKALLAQAAEYAEYGWTVTGQPKIVRMSVRPHGKALRVRACVDESAVRVTDRHGNKLPSNTGRTWMLFSLTHAAAGWQVADQTFPPHPDC